MATIKLNAQNKILTKNGKVSCGCCEEPGECCPYPAKGYLDGIYSYDDLPETLIWANTGAIITKQPEGSYYLYVSEPTGENQVYVEFGCRIWNNAGRPYWIGRGNFAWRPLPRGVNDGSFVPGDCLIVNRVEDKGGTADQFADTYTVTYSYDANPLGEATFIHSETVTVTRQSLCQWRGTDSCGNPLWLEIVLFDEDKPEETFLSWAISFYMYRTDYSINATEILCNTGSQGNALKQGFQNTPLGNYKFAFQNLVVS